MSAACAVVHALSLSEANLLNACQLIAALALSVGFCSSSSSPSLHSLSIRHLGRHDPAPAPSACVVGCFRSRWGLSRPGAQWQCLPHSWQFSSPVPRCER